MNNVWKGLVVGAVTGAAIGLTMDGLRRGGEGAAALAGQLRDHRGEVAAALASATGAGAATVREAAKTAASSDAARNAQEAAKNAVNSAIDAAKDLAAKNGH